MTIGRATALCLVVMLGLWRCSFDTSGLTAVSTGTRDGAARDKSQTSQDQAISTTCQPGLTRCGDRCVDLRTTLSHCGACNTSCSPEDSDRCIDGACRCGGGAPCASGLNCRGEGCVCIPNGRCNGCCDNETCVPLGASQPTSKCGQAGQPCVNCETNQICRVDSCSNGVCVHQIQQEGTVCDDGLWCTVQDACIGGTCIGLPRNCSPVGPSTCIDASCNEASKTCVQACKVGVPCGKDRRCVGGPTWCQCVEDEH